MKVLLSRWRGCPRSSSSRPSSGCGVILAANAWMQHPVGYRIVGNKAELTDFWAVLRNSTLWAEFSHTVLAAFVTGAMFVLGASGWQLLRGRNAGGRRGVGVHRARHGHR